MYIQIKISLQAIFRLICRPFLFIYKHPCFLLKQKLWVAWLWIFLMHFQMDLLGSSFVMWVFQLVQEIDSDTQVYGQSCTWPAPSLLNSNGINGQKGRKQDLALFSPCFKERKARHPSTSHTLSPILSHALPYIVLPTNAYCFIQMQEYF